MANQFVVGLTLNILVLGLTSFLASELDPVTEDPRFSSPGLGFLVAPILLLGVAWLAAVGAKLLTASSRAVPQARRTAVVTIPVALLIGAYSLWTLDAAARSSDEGGGLLGGFGLIPMVLAITLAVISILTFVLTRPDNGSDGRRAGPFSQNWLTVSAR